MRRPRLIVTALTLSAMVAWVGGRSALAADIYWNDGDGGSSTILSATWNDLQTAINSAQGGGAAGMVKVSGDLTRTAGDVTVGDLAVTTGNLTISGGWNSTFTTQGAASTLNVNGAQSANNQFRVMAISGANTVVDNFSMTKGSPYKDYGGGVYVSSTGSNTTLQNLQVTGNYAYGQYGNSYGGGIAIVGAYNVKVSNSVIENNQAQVGGGGIYVGSGSGTASQPVIIEGSTISGNSAVKANYQFNSYGGGIQFVASGSTGISYGVIAECKIEDNTAKWGGGLYASSYNTTSRLTVFGTLIDGNYVSRKTGDSQGAGAGNGLYFGDDHLTTYVVNSTIADNVRADDATITGVYVQGGSYNGNGRVILVNSLSTTNNNGYYEERYSTYQSSAHSAFVDFQNSTVSEAQYYEKDDAGDTISATLAAAVTNIGNANTGYRSFNALGVQSYLLEGNIDGNPSYVGTGVDPLDPYQLSAGSNSLDNGILQIGTHADITGGDSGQFAYVDVNMNGAYNSALDIIVGLFGASVTGTSASHLIYVTDLLGNDRISGAGIDRGAYEYQSVSVPEPITAALLSLGGLGLVASRRRRQRR
ncbi:MAG: hypothetical protein BIFFINMI_01066 [Phycisphaerae bacterium]|nr:hypothetical protein [Phycisphaerae bacterium]